MSSPYHTPSETGGSTGDSSSLTTTHGNSETGSGTTTHNPTTVPTTTDPTTTWVSTTDPVTTTVDPTTTDPTTTKPTRTSDSTTSTTTTTTTTSSKSVTSASVDSTTTTPYTTRYITTVSIITVTTVIPKPTTISGRGTTVFITDTTTTETPTLIPDPNQPPPPGTLIDSAQGSSGLKTWQTILIVVACLVVAMAVGAVCLVGRTKKRRQRQLRLHQQQMQQQQSLGSLPLPGQIHHRDSWNYGSDVFASSGVGGGGNNSHHQFHANGGGGGGGGGGISAAAAAGVGAGAGAGESVQGSEFADSVDRSNRTLIAPAGQHRLSLWFNKFMRPWQSNRSSQHSTQPLYGQNGSPGGLWLIEDGGRDPSYEGSVAAAAALHPVSYQNDPLASSSSFPHQHQYVGYFPPYAGMEDEIFAASAMEPSVPPPQSQAQQQQQPQMSEVNHGNNHRMQDDSISLNTGAATAASPSLMGVSVSAGVGTGASAVAGGSDPRYRIPPSTTSPVTSQSLTRLSGGESHMADLGASGIESIISSPHMRLSASTDYLDSCYGNRSSQSQSRHLSQDQESLARNSSIHRESHDWARIAGMGDHGSRRDTMLLGQNPGERSTVVVVDPDHLETNAIYEHVRKGPQALPGASSPSPVVAAAAPSSSSAAPAAATTMTTPIVNTERSGPSPSVTGSLRTGRLNQ
ncbi:hypothetical protein BGX31_006201 [Mortierella sp. GBA43]|nr:hypothetical protein BGX31_006201 [Mortierella sp. GBA43]